MAYGLSNGNVTPKVLEAVRSAILATAWLLVFVVASQCHVMMSWYTDELSLYALD